jgi:hypothetical protein
MSEADQLRGLRMKRIVVFVVLAVAVLVFSSQVMSADLFLNNINDTCETKYSCSICHASPGGGGDFKENGAFTVTHDYEPCSFCERRCVDGHGR